MSVLQCTQFDFCVLQLTIIAQSGRILCLLNMHYANLVLLGLYIALPVYCIGGLFIDIFIFFRHVLGQDGQYLT